jgi:ATP-dependent DNA ligase
MGIRFHEHVEGGSTVFAHACKLGFEGIVSKRLGSPYTRGIGSPAIKREAEEDWGKEKWR